MTATPLPAEFHLDVQHAGVVQMRDATDDEIPASARRLAEVARANGWAVRVTYAAGHQEKPSSCLAVRMVKPDRAMYAIWHDPRPAVTPKGKHYITGAFQGAWALGPGVSPRGLRYIHLGRIGSEMVFALADGSQELSA